MDTIILDHQLQETLVFPDPSFPIQYYVDDLHQWAGRQVPLHWHFGYEFFSAVSQDIEVQVGNEQLMLLKDESILITGGQLHSYRLTSPQEPCLCPNIVFSDNVLAPLTSTVFQKYLRHILNDSALPCIIISGQKDWQREISECLFRIYGIFTAEGNLCDTAPDQAPVKSMHSDCPEIDVHLSLFEIFKILYCHRSELHHIKISRPDQKTQIRLQKMLHYIQTCYPEKLTLEKIAASAGISRSEAGRCFKRYCARSSMSYVLLYRLKQAQELLVKSSLSVSEISFLCGFRDSSYFIKVFRKYLNCTPCKYRQLYSSVL